jgi:hypothetical protein
VLNPYGDNGIKLFVDATGTVPKAFTVLFDYTGSTGNAPDGINTVAFSQLRTAHFPMTRRPTFHYVVWAHRVEGAWGMSDQTPDVRLAPGDDAVIGIMGLAQTARTQAEFLAHELGHNLGQRHAGLIDGDEEQPPPPYLSVMSLAWVRRTTMSAVLRRRLATCLPFYYAKAGETEVGNLPPTKVNSVIDYSAGMAKPVIEGMLDAVKGVCNQKVDWDRDGFPGEAMVPASTDLNGNGILTDRYDDFANWPYLQFQGPRSGGGILP